MLEGVPVPQEVIPGGRSGHVEVQEYAAAAGPGLGVLRYKVKELFTVSFSTRLGLGVSK